MSLWRCKQFFKTNYRRLILLLLLIQSCEEQVAVAIRQMHSVMAC